MRRRQHQLKLSQKRYFDDPALFNKSNDQFWQIPVCAKGINGETAGKQECFLLTKREQEFQLKGCSKFVFPNSNALGYYRFNYDSAALHADGQCGREGADAGRTHRADRQRVGADADRQAQRWRLPGAWARN